MGPAATGRCRSHARAHLGVPAVGAALALAGRAERDAVEQHAARADVRGLADDDAARVVDEDARADARARVDVDVEARRRAPLQQ